MNNVNIRIIEDQSEEINDVELSQDQIDAFLYRYNKDLYKQVKAEEEKKKPHKPLPHQRRNFDQESYNTQYSDTKFVDSDEMSFKIEIKSDHKL